MDENKKETKGETEGVEKDKQVSYDRNKPFSKDNQPPGDVKSAGWWKKKKGREMLRHLLQLDFDGTTIDPMTGAKVPNKIREQVAEYMGVPIESVTNEMVLFAKQIGLAIQKNDTQAAALVLNNAYGQPKETFQVYEDKKPEIIIQPMQLISPEGENVPLIVEEWDGAIENNNSGQANQ